MSERPLNRNFTNSSMGLICIAQGKAEGGAMFVVPSIFGKPVYVWSGLLLFFLITFQVGVGLRWIPVNFNVHRWNGKFVIPIVILGHAFFAVAAYFFGVKVQGF